VDPTRLKIGQKVKIPAPSPTSSAGPATAAPNGGANVYVVKSGDNLGRIASRNGTTVRELQRLNNLTTTQIRVGQKLKLPARPAPDGGAPAPAQ
jgi:LysM repeat protein